MNRKTIKYRCKTQRETGGGGRDILKEREREKGRETHREWGE